MMLKHADENNSNFAQNFGSKVALARKWCNRDVSWSSSTDERYNRLRSTKRLVKIYGSEVVNVSS